MRIPQTTKKVEEAVLDVYLKSGQPVVVKEICEQSGLSDSAIRNHLRKAERLSVTSRSVMVMSKNYPGVLHQHREVEAFMPSRRWLVDLLLQSRREHHYDRTERKFGR